MALSNWGRSDWPSRRQNGQIQRLFPFENKDVKLLSIFPGALYATPVVAPEAGDYACVRCSEVIRMNVGKSTMSALQIQNGRRQAGLKRCLTAKISDLYG